MEDVFLEGKKEVEGLSLFETCLSLLWKGLFIEGSSYYRQMMNSVFTCGYYLSAVRSDLIGWKVHSDTVRIFVLNSKDRI